MGRKPGQGYMDFRCWSCRRNGAHDHAGWPARIFLTGRQRPARHRDGIAPTHTSDVAREYVCQDCDYVGWSHHQALEGIAPTPNLRSPWARIMLAGDAGRGLFLSADDVEQLMGDWAMVARGRQDLSGEPDGPIPADEERPP